MVASLAGEPNTEVPATVRTTPPLPSRRRAGDPKGDRPRARDFGEDEAPSLSRSMVENLDGEPNTELPTPVPPSFMDGATPALSRTMLENLVGEPNTEDTEDTEVPTAAFPSSPLPLPERKEGGRMQSLGVRLWPGPGTISTSIESEGTSSSSGSETAR